MDRGTVAHKCCSAQWTNPNGQQVKSSTPRSFAAQDKAIKPLFISDLRFNVISTDSSKMLPPLIPRERLFVRGISLPITGERSDQRSRSPSRLASQMIDADDGTMIDLSRVGSRAPSRLGGQYSARTSRNTSRNSSRNASNSNSRSTSPTHESESKSARTLIPPLQLSAAAAAAAADATEQRIAPSAQSTGSARLHIPKLQRRATTDSQPTPRSSSGASTPTTTAGAQGKRWFDIDLGESLNADPSH